MDAHVDAPAREGLLDRVFHDSLVGMVVARLDDGIVVEANDAACRLLGLGPGDLVDASVDDLGLWGELGPLRARERLRRTGSIDGYDSCLTADGGEARVVRVWAEAVGSGERLVVIRAAREHHAEVEAKYRSLVEQLPAVVYLGEFGEQGDWLYISPQIERVHGLTPQEWLAHPGPQSAFTHPDDLPCVRDEEDRSFRTRTPFRAEYRMRRKDGRWIWILDEAAAVPGENGKPLFMQGVMYDITQRREAEERLVALDRLKNTLLHTLSHDLKEPLTAILGAASTLERLDRELDTQERADLLRTMVDRTRGMNALLTDLLDLDRLDRGIIEPRRFPIDLDRLVRTLVTRTEALCEHVVRVESSRCVANLDVAKVERMVENLLANAARHTPTGSRVWVRVWADETGSTIAVEDDGAGVPDELKCAIFEPFRRGPDPRQPGSGIGLSLVARFAELHGGRAWVEDREGGGSSFRIFLPEAPPTSV